MIITRRLIKIVVPIKLFALIVLLGFGLYREPVPIPSPLVGKPLPSMQLPPLGTPAPAEVSDACAGSYCLINLFASWCTGCITEHSELLALDKSNVLTLVGINHQDTQEGAYKMLAMGNPYQTVFFDQEGSYGFALGAYGVPESYLVGPDGLVLTRIAGPITAGDVSSILQLVQ